MNNKILLALGVIVVILALGNALQCNFCVYWSNQPKCPDLTMSCGPGVEYCFTSLDIYPDGKRLVARGCGSSSPSDKRLCPAEKGKEICDEDIKKGRLKFCTTECCKTNNCNNYTPSSATNIMVTKFSLFLMMFASFLFAKLVAL